MNLNFFLFLQGLFERICLHLSCLSHAESLVGWRRGRLIYIKGVSVRFGFDGLRTSQLQQYVKNKATETPQGVYYIYPQQAMVRCTIPVGVSIYVHRRGAFSVARFDNPGNAKAFIAWNE